MKNLTVFGKEIIEDKAISQMENCLSDGDIGVLTADCHYGYQQPVGGVAAYKNKISISGVGWDIGCGNMAVKTNIYADRYFYDRVPVIMDEIFKRISFGMGRPNNEPVDHILFDLIENAAFEGQRKLLNLAKSQLGTVGGGNHFIDLFEDEEGYVWIGVHFGSRGFGHKTAGGFIAMSQGLTFNDKGSEGSMDSKPILLDMDSYIGQAYYEAMILAGKYATAGREVVINKVLQILGNPITNYTVHNHHNFAWKENHFGEDYYVVRKGATPAFPGQQGFIGANMLDKSVIVEGVESELSKSALYSTVHGAGRILSRTQAVGKSKWIRGEDGKKRKTIVAKGCVDFDSVKKNMKNYDVELRGAGADEAPECYKKLTDVLSHMKGTIKVIHTLTPIGVAMAGSETIDEYKD
jgi:tRNA-splicing ligase RtcB